MTNQTPQTGYASVNGLKMYYEIHGTGKPLVVLHGAYMNTVTMGGIIPRLAANRQVIAVDFQAHGRTGDIDRPLNYDFLADDVAKLIKSLNIEKADIFGYSMGGSTALKVAINHPEVVNRIVVISANYRTDGYYPEVLAMIGQMTPEMLIGSPLEDAYKPIAPNPDDFPNLVRKLVALDGEVFAWLPESIRGITAPALLIWGDSDVVKPEHAIELFRLMGGGVSGDMVGLPNVRLAIIPGTTHINVLDRANWVAEMTIEFLDAESVSAPPPSF